MSIERALRDVGYRLPELGRLDVHEVTEAGEPPREDDDGRRPNRNADAAVDALDRGLAPRKRTFDPARLGIA
ncbi:MAG: hypothetical protein ACREJX_19565, partial [Polyangiaceae bacterium]